MGERFTNAYQVKAKENLAEAEACLSAQLRRAAISRGYYALYQAANAWMTYRGTYAKLDPIRQNWHHETVEEHWEQILDDLYRDAGVESDFDGDILYGRLKELRIRVDYKLRPDPTLADAERAVDASRRAVGWLLAALRKAGK